MQALLQSLVEEGQEIQKIHVELVRQLKALEVDYPIQSSLPRPDLSLITLCRTRGCGVKEDVMRCHSGLLLGLCGFNVEAYISVMH